MVHHYKVDCFVKRLDCFVVVQVKVTEKVRNSSECSAGWYPLSCWTFCNQTWYGDATSWAKVSCKKIGLLSSSSGTQWGLIWSNMTCFYNICWTAYLFATRFNWMVHHHKLECFVEKLRLLFSRLRSQQRLNTLLNLYVYLISSVPLISWQPN